MKQYLNILLVAGCLTACTSEERVINWDSSVSFDKISYHAVERKSDESILANIHGISSSDQTVYYHVNWYDVNGMPIDTIMSSCSKKQIYAHKPFDWKLVAPTPKAYAFNVFISSRCENNN